MNKDNLAQILEFCKLIDREKFIQRKTYLTGGERWENDAEHAWHLAVMALLLGGCANGKVDTFRVMGMVLIHDLVEIYAGDTFAYDYKGMESQQQREAEAADRLYSQLPDEQSALLRGLWEEFNANETPESRFANTLDKFQPLQQQAITNGKAWTEMGRKFSEVYRRTSPIAQGSQALWDYALEEILEPQMAKGHLKDDRE